MSVVDKTAETQEMGILKYSIEYDRIYLLKLVKKVEKCIPNMEKCSKTFVQEK